MKTEALAVVQVLEEFCTRHEASNDDLLQRHRTVNEKVQMLEETLQYDLNERIQTLEESLTRHGTSAAAPIISQPVPNHYQHSEEAGADDCSHSAIKEQNADLMAECTRFVVTNVSFDRCFGFVNREAIIFKLCAQML